MMTSFHFMLCLLVPLITGATLSAAPIAERRPVSSTVHGHTQDDDYAWLRDKEDPEVIEYLEAENAHAEATTAHLEAFRTALYEEMLRRIKQTDLSVPWRKGEYFYYARTEEGKSYQIHCRRRGSLEAPEEVLLDVNELAEGEEYLRVLAQTVSPDHRLMAYAVDTSGYERCDIFVKNLETGETLATKIEDASGWSLEWGNDSRTLFYTRVDATNRPDRLFRHTLGSDPAHDALVFHEPDEAFYMWFGRTRSDALLTMTLQSINTSEIWLLDADAPEGEPRVVDRRRRGVEYDVEHHGDRLLIRTNENATNFRLLESPLEDLSTGKRREIRAHDPDVYLTGVDAFRDHLVFTERRGGYMVVSVQDVAGGGEHRIETPEEVSTLTLSVNPEFDTRTLRLTYSSPITPTRIYDYDMATRARTLLKQDEIPSGHDPAEYVTKRIWATAPDGVRVPVSVVHRRGIELDGDNPCLLYGYGSYGLSMDPRFNSAVYSLLDRGFVYAIGHIRGGSEMGRRWYEDGKFLKKRNTFTDFIACAEALVEAGYTRPQRLAIQGGSAGGLLIGAVVNMRPELFGAAHASVPFVDVVNTMLDASIPLTVLEYDEWGNPNDPEYFEYILSYSPYDNVRAQEYPHMLITAGLNDPRVHFWEPAKWTAKLRAMKTDDNTLLLRTNMDAGHGGASGRYARLEELAWEYAFLIERVAPERAK